MPSLPLHPTCLQVWLQALTSDAASGLLPPPLLEARLPADVRWLGVNAACALALDAEGHAYVLPAGCGSEAAVELR